MNALQRLLHPKNTAKAANVAGAAVGIAAGAAAAPSIAAAAGVTAIPVLTALGNLVGLTILTATPVGWIVGTATAAGAIGLGVAKLAGGIGGDLRESRIDEDRRSQPPSPSEKEVAVVAHHARPFLSEEDQGLLAEHLLAGSVRLEDARAALKECKKLAGSIPRL